MSSAGADMWQRAAGRIVDGCLLAAVFALVLGSLAPVDWLIGFAIGLLIPHAFGPTRAGIAIRMPAFLAGATLMAANGSVRTLAALVSPRRAAGRGYVTIVCRDCTPSGMDALAYAITAAPGSAIAEIHEQERRLEMHAIDAADAESLRAEIDRFYRRYQRGTFP